MSENSKKTVSPATLLKAWDLRPKKQLGQNFLSDPAIAQKIVNAAGISNDDIILEIGSGLGSLTIPLAQTAGKVFAVETDRRLAKLLGTQLLLHQISNVVIIEQDILKFDINGLADESTNLIVVGNLPYHISSQILIRLISARTIIHRAVLMFQKELAQRLSAPPGNRVYGRLSVMVQYCARIRLLTEVKAAAFFPKPNIDSQVLDILFTGRSEIDPEDDQLLFDVIKAAFGKRRKTLRNSLGNSELDLDRDVALAVLESADIDASRRAETLSVAEFIKLKDAYKKFI